MEALIDVLGWLFGWLLWGAAWIAIGTATFFALYGLLCLVLAVIHHRLDRKARIRDRRAEQSRRAEAEAARWEPYRDTDPTDLAVTIYVRRAVVQDGKHVQVGSANRIGRVMLRAEGRSLDETRALIETHWEEAQAMAELLNEPLGPAEVLTEEAAIMAGYAPPPAWPGLTPGKAVDATWTPPQADPV